MRCGKGLNGNPKSEVWEGSRSGRMSEYRTALEVCDEADSCGEAVRASVKRNDEHCLQNCGIVPACFSKPIDIRFLDVRRVTCELIGKPEELHNLGFDGRTRVLESQLARQRLVDTQSSKDF